MALQYMDPGTGSYILQLLVAGVFGLAYTLKVYRDRLLAWFRGESPEEEAAEEGDGDAEETDGEDGG